MDRRIFMKSIAMAGAACAVPGAFAQQPKYPSKPIHFVVPYAAGGGGDVVARMLAQQFTERTGATVVVDNKVGAGGNIGADYVLKSAPDGYTVLNMSSTYPIQAAVTKLPFDPIADMQPVIMISRDPVVVLVHPDSPFKDARYLADAARKNPDKYTHGSAGVGSLAHLGMEELAFVMGVKLVHIPYKGSSQAFNDLLGRNVDLMLTSATFSGPYIRSGRVRALGIAGTERVATLPDVPTFEEQGFRGYNVVDWKAVAAPKGTPREIVDYLNGELNAILKGKVVTDKFRAEGTLAVGGSPEEMMRIVRSDIARWKNVVEKANVRIE